MVNKLHMTDVYMALNLLVTSCSPEKSYLPTNIYITNPSTAKDLLITRMKHTERKQFLAFF